MPSQSASAGPSAPGEMSARTPVSIVNPIRPGVPLGGGHSAVPEINEGTAATAVLLVNDASVTGEPGSVRSAMRKRIVQRFAPASDWVAENSSRSGTESSAGP